MQTYDNYRPEINYGEDPQIPEKREETPMNPEPRKRRNRRQKPDPKINSNVEPKPEASKKSPGAFKRFFKWFGSTQCRILTGIFFGLLTIYLTAAFFGYFGTCIEDQSKIADTPVGLASNISNPGGEGGARLSELLINQGFGLGSLVIIVWLGALSLKLLVGRPRFRTLEFTIKSLVALITVSLIIGLVTFNMHTQVNWGGYHGTYVNEFIINFIGNIGAGLLSIFMLAVFVMICLRDLVNWIIRKKRARDERRRIAAEEKAARLAKEEEIRRMQEQEKIDDLRAGETVNIGNADNIDIDDHEVNFDEATKPLYEIEDRVEAGTTEVKITDESGKTGNEKETQSLSTQEDVTNGAEGNQSAENIDEIENAENNDKMVVNVNAIGQSGSKRFVPDVVRLESHKYKFPPFDLLREGKQNLQVDTEEQMENKRKIRQTLLDFGIPITRIEATVGPTVTLYEIVPENGVKIAKIRGLVDDIALSLAAIGVRIIAPIPGKGTVGIEVANNDPQTVSMRTVIQSNKYQMSRYNLPVALGSTISNDVYIADLTKMPHLLVAGATGQGKSVCLNAIVASLLYCKAPHELKFVMIDPKQLEFNLYNKIKNYYMASLPEENEEPVVTDMTKAEETLNSLCVEMERRYSLLKKAKVRNIEEYNARIREGNLNPAEGHCFQPYLVIIVDEFADLLMVSGKGIETPIARIAQKARAAGMHIILATQRPSANVITGIIKANFPSRIAFKVSSGIDSKTILDATGAQQLIGRGDMLIMNNSEIVRVQCAFIDTPEVEAICDYIEKQPYPQGVYELPEPPSDSGNGKGDDSLLDDDMLDGFDPKLAEVARAVVNSGRASTSAVQRTYGMGYNRAGRIMDQLERLGVVDEAHGGKPRVVLVDPMKLEEILATIE